ncbi:hypothetical protein Tco_0804869 [Tanacetum coccineum]
MPPEDEVLLAEEQPLPAALSPTADSPVYVPESDPEEDPEEDDDEDSEEDPVDYPTDRGDDRDDDDESSDDDEDDDVDIEGDEEEEEHPALADSRAVALPVVDHAPSAEETESFETDKLPTLVIPTPPPSPLSSWSSPLHQIPSPPLPVSLPLPASPTYLLGYRAAMIRLRAKAPSTSHSPSPHIILSYTIADTPPVSGQAQGLLTTSEEVCFAFGPREIMRDLERDVGYGITDTWEEMLTERQLMASRLNMLYRDRRAHARTTLLMEREAGCLERLGDDPWTLVADRRRQAMITELLAVNRRRQA